MGDLLKSEKKIRALSGDIREALATGEKMASAANKAAVSANEAALTADKLITRIYERGEPGSFDVMEWLDTFRQATEAAKQAQALIAKRWTSFLRTPVSTSRWRSSNRDLMRCCCGPSSGPPC